MPISQQRILSLVSEGEEILSSYLSLRSSCEQLLSSVKRGESTPEESLGLLQTFLTLHPEPSPLHLLLEKRHFALEGRRNQRKKERMRELRSGSAKPSLTSPDILSTLEAKKQSLPDDFYNWQASEGTSELSDPTSFDIGDET